jgi:hypothetical protein
MTIPRYSGNQFAARGVLKKLRDALIITDTTTDDQAFRITTAYAKLRDMGTPDNDALLTMAMPPMRGELPPLEDTPALEY